MHFLNITFIHDNMRGKDVFPPEHEEKAKETQEQTFTCAHHAFYFTTNACHKKYASKYHEATLTLQTLKCV